MSVVLVDRDGVINEDPIGGYVTCAEDFRFLPGVLPALSRLSRAGFEIVVISNQAGVGDGIFTQKELDRVNAKMVDVLRRRGVNLRAVYYCTHGKTAGCRCRKPGTGLLERAQEEISFRKEDTYFIGDKTSDLEAGARFGIPTILVQTGYGAGALAELERAEKSSSSVKAAPKPAFVAKNVSQAVRFLIARTARRTASRKEALR